MQKKLNYQLDYDEDNFNHDVEIEKINSPSLAHLISQSSSNNLLSIRDSHKVYNHHDIRIVVVKKCVLGITLMSSMYPIKH